jgi:hypothetical protein
MMSKISRVLGYVFLSVVSVVGAATLMAPTAVAQTAARITAVTQSGTWNITNVSGTVSLPTGAATETSVNGLEADLALVKTAVETLENAIDGTGINISKIGGIAPAGACTPVSMLLTTTVETELDDDSGIIDFANIFSINDAPVYVHFYDLDADDTDENDTPVFTLVSTANSTAASGAGSNPASWPGGMNFGTGITIRAVKGISRTSTTALDNSEVIINYCKR